jgi:hypothetical protein
MKGSRLKPDIQFNKKRESKSQEKLATAFNGSGHPRATGPEDLDHRQRYYSHRCEDSITTGKNSDSGDRTVRRATASVM